MLVPVVPIERRDCLGSADDEGAYIEVPVDAELPTDDTEEVRATVTAAESAKGLSDSD